MSNMMHKLEEDQRNGLKAQEFAKILEGKLLDARDEQVRAPQGEPMRGVRGGVELHVRTARHCSPAAQFPHWHLPILSAQKRGLRITHRTAHP